VQLQRFYEDCSLRNINGHPDFGGDGISKTQRHNQLIDGLHGLPSQIRNVLQLDRTLQQLAASTLRNAQSLLIMGRGFQYSTCLGRR
jgi:glucosamine 6-phosphate synthetase-like amidotransferase/phosphosugar isomerase protein